MKIDRAEIVREALALLDEVGLNKLSTRALAMRLGVQQPALYWHFKDKRELMDAMNAEMMRTAHVYRVGREGDDWRSYLLQTCQSFRRALLSFRDGARVHAGSRAEVSDRDAAEQQLRFLVDQGFDTRSALRVLVTLLRFTVGFVLEEQAEKAHPPVNVPEESSSHPLLAEAFENYKNYSQDQLFLEGIEAIIAGVSSTAIAPAI